MKLVKYSKIFYRRRKTIMKILLLGLVWPEPTSSAAGWRLLQIIKLLCAGNEVHFASAAMKSEFSYDLKSLGVIEEPIYLNDSSFDVYIKTLAPDVVIFDRFMVEEQYGWRVIANCPNALRILDTEDLHFVRLARQESYKKGTPLQLKSDTAKREIASILRSDLSLIISSEEIKLLIEEFNIPSQQLFYLPFQEHLLSEQEIFDRRKFDERSDFIFIGNFIHEPNWRTVEILKREIWPELRKSCPTASLHIYGAYASEKVLQLHNERDRFFIKGRAVDARDTMENYRVLIAPIPFGAGAKGKFVDAMYAGTPTVSSKVGAESMSSDDVWNGFITDEKREFIDKSVLLYADQKVWEESQQAGFEIFNTVFADNTHSVKFLNWIDTYHNNVHVLRESNFLGQILLQNQLSATKYMSLWIEEKNKRKSEN